MSHVTSSSLVLWTVIWPCSSGWPWTIRSSGSPPSTRSPQKKHFLPQILTHLLICLWHDLYIASLEIYHHVHHVHTRCIAYHCTCVRVIQRENLISWTWFQVLPFCSPIWQCFRKNPQLRTWSTCNQTNDSLNSNFDFGNEYFDSY